MNTIKIVGNLLLFFVVLAFPTSTSGFLAGLSDSGSYVQCTFPGDSTCTGQADPDGSQWLCARVSTVTGSACQMTCDLMFSGTYKVGDGTGGCGQCVEHPPGSGDYTTYSCNGLDADGLPILGSSGAKQPTAVTSGTLAVLTALALFLHAWW